MPFFFVMLTQLARAIWNGLRDKEFRALLTLVVIILLCGTFFYARAEDWNWLDALYFSVMTLTTVGYGDLVPKQPLSKVFTMIYVLIGIGVLLVFVEKVAKHAVAGRREK